jgi:hypothetical protein
MLEEQQICFALQIVQHMQVTGITSVDPKRDVQTKWHDDIQERLKKTIWHVDCGGWYKHGLLDGG